MAFIFVTPADPKWALLFENRDTRTARRGMAERNWQSEGATRHSCPPKFSAILPVWGWLAPRKIPCQTDLAGAAHDTSPGVGGEGRGGREGRKKKKEGREEGKRRGGGRKEEVGKGGRKGGRGGKGALAHFVTRVFLAENSNNDLLALFSYISPSIFFNTMLPEIHKLLINEGRKEPLSCSAET